MLSFRFDLTAGQTRVLMSIYSGDWQPLNDRKRNHAEWIKEGQRLSHSHFVPIVDRLIDKGLVYHVSGREIGSNGFYCTEKGKTIARMILEDAEKIIASAQLAKKRGVA
jgi:hypothetical protein